METLLYRGRVLVITPSQVWVGNRCYRAASIVSFQKTHERRTVFRWLIPVGRADVWFLTIHLAGGGWHRVSFPKEDGCNRAMRAMSAAFASQRAQPVQMAFIGRVNVNRFQR